MYDLRVVRFIKTLDSCSIKNNESADYICLGHFDMMHIESLGSLTTEPLAVIQKDRDVLGEGEFNCSENHVYSLYILRNAQESEREDLIDFWNKDGRGAYTVVTRIHCDYPDGWEDKSPFSKIISEYCSKQSSDHVTGCAEEKCVLNLQGDINAAGGIKADVRCLIYDSLELGDSVAIMKGNSLAAILEVVRHISTNPCVRDTYTYCGVSRDLLQNVTLELSQVVAEGAELSHVSTRFSIRSRTAANIFFEKLLKNMDVVPQFYVTGTADHIIHWGKCSEEKLLEILREITQQSDSMYFSFNDIVTRVGIEQENNEGGDVPQPEQETESKLVRDGRVTFFRETVTWLRDDLRSDRARSDSEINWKYSLLKLLGTLETMYENYVMDDLANLIIPSVDALLVRIHHIKEHNGGRIPADLNGNILAFLRYWASLTNDISQLEGQLTQHPELVPVRYYIPAMLLQFELKFVEYCCNALADEGTRSFRPMLLPTDTEELYTYSPLDPKQEDYQKKCPLLVFVPLQDLYRPWQIAHRIAHEIAHYCGDAGRKRNDRHRVLIECMASFLANRWFYGFSRFLSEEEKDKLFDKTIKYVDILANMLDEMVHQKNPNVKEWYLSLSKIKINSVVKDIVLDERHFEQYLFYYDPSIFYNERNEYHEYRNRSIKQSIQSAAIRFREIRNHLDGLAHLCAECYADIAMVLLLKCGFNDYYTCVYHDEYQKLCKIYSEGVDSPPFAGGVLVHIDRMALVIYAIRGISDPDLRDQWEGDLAVKTVVYSSQWIGVASQFVDCIDQNVSKNFDAIHKEIEALPIHMELVRLGKFLRRCAEDIEEKLDHDSNCQASKEVVRENIKYVKDGSFDWERLRQFLTSSN